MLLYIDVCYSFSNTCTFSLVFIVSLFIAVPFSMRKKRRRSLRKEMAQGKYLLSLNLTEEEENEKEEEEEV